jgi:hypothetical protein
VRQPCVAAVEQLFDNQRLEILFVTPENHQDDDLELAERDMIVVEDIARSIDQLAQGGRDQVGCFEKGDETQAVDAELALLLLEVDSQRIRCSQADRPRSPLRPSSQRRAMLIASP